MLLVTAQIYDLSNFTCSVTTDHAIPINQGFSVPINPSLNPAQMNAVLIDRAKAVVVELGGTVSPNEKIWFTGGVS